MVADTSVQSGFLPTEDLFWGEWGRGTFMSGGDLLLADGVWRVWRVGTTSAPWLDCLTFCEAEFNLCMWVPRLLWRARAESMNFNDNRKTFWKWVQTEKKPDDESEGLLTKCNKMLIRIKQLKTTEVLSSEQALLHRGMGKRGWRKGYLVFWNSEFFPDGSPWTLVFWFFSLFVFHCSVFTAMIIVKWHSVGCAAYPLVK